MSGARLPVDAVPARQRRAVGQRRRRIRRRAVAPRRCGQPADRWPRGQGGCVRCCWRRVELHVPEVGVVVCAPVEARTAQHVRIWQQLAGWAGAGRQQAHSAEACMPQRSDVWRPSGMEHVWDSTCYGAHHRAMAPMSSHALPSFSFSVTYARRAKHKVSQDDMSALQQTHSNRHDVCMAPQQVLRPASHGFSHCHCLLPAAPHRRRSPSPASCTPAHQTS
jgi:hypothetical protein